MASVLNSILNGMFKIFLFPFQNINPWFGMIFISLLTGLFMLFIFKLTSNQQGIKKAKNKIKAHLLELRLYKDDLRTSLKAQGNIILSNLKYMNFSLKPLLVMIIPIILIIIQMNFWFAYDSLETGEKALLKIQLAEGYRPTETNVNIQSHDGIKIETPPLRIDESGEIDWRFSANKKGLHELKIQVGENLVTKSISVNQKPLSKISPLKRRKSFLNQILYPVEKPLEKSSSVKLIEITYPSSGFHIFGIKIHWIITFFILSIIFGFSLKGLFGVEI